MNGRRWAALLVLLFMMAVGCARPQESGPVQGGTLTLGLLRAPAGVFRPLAGGARDDGVAIGLMYSGLLRTGPQLELLCDLCERFDVSPDGRTVTFSLRKDVQWHDGKPFTADDVAFTYRALLAPEFAGTRPGELSALAGVQKLLDERDAVGRQVAAGQLSAAGGGARKAEAWRRWLVGPGAQAIRVVDAHTVSFTMDAPYAPLLTAMVLPISPAHTREPVGTGPFRFAEFRRGEYVKLVRHPAYHWGAPHVETVILRAVAPDRAADAVTQGVVDFVPISQGDAARVGSGVSVVEWPHPGYQYLGVNQDLPLFADRRVRQALLYGINRQALVAQLLGGRGSVVNGHLPANHWAAAGVMVNSYPPDPARAAALLNEAGWSQFSPDGTRMRDGVRLAFTLKAPKGREAAAALIQHDLKALGVKVRVEPVEFAQLTREVFGARQAEAWLLGWRVGLDPDPGPAFAPENKWGRASGWLSRRSQELLGRGARTLDQAQRKAIYGEWAQLTNAELPYLFLYAEHDLAAVRAERVHGVKPDLRGPFWNINEWWINATAPQR